MLDEIPSWTFSSSKPLTQWYGHVHLLRDHAVGQWFCVHRESGQLMWQHAMLRANDICNIDSGVIVASEMRSDGPWTATLDVTEFRSSMVSCCGPRTAQGFGERLADSWTSSQVLRMSFEIIHITYARGRSTATAGEC